MCTEADTGNSMRGPHLLLASGRKFYPLDPHPTEFTWEDIASGLVAAGRYQGQLPTAPRGAVYTVAQHVVLASRRVRIPLLRRAMFHHDDVEALWGFGDVCGPVKRLPEVAGLLKPMEARVEAVVAARSGLPESFADWREVKFWDRYMAAWEDRDLRGIDRGAELDGVPLPSERLRCWSAEFAYAEWWREHRGLQAEAIAAQRAAVDELAAQFAAYDGGDRPPSPPASLMRDERDARERLRLLERP